MGRADLFGFIEPRICKIRKRKTSVRENKAFSYVAPLAVVWTIALARRLPFAESGDFVPTESESAFYLSDSLSIGLDKDNREALSRCR